MKFQKWLRLRENFYNEQDFAQQLTKLLEKNYLSKVFKDLPNIIMVKSDYEDPKTKIITIEVHDILKELFPDKNINWDTGIEIWKSMKDVPDLIKKIKQATEYYMKELGAEFTPAQKVPEGYAYKVQVPSHEKDDYSHLDPNMQHHLSTNQWIDVNDVGYEVEPGLWKLNRYIDGSEYVDSKTGKFIQFIYEYLPTGEIFATYSKDPSSDKNVNVFWAR